jgi:hypothetical protein
VKFLPTGAVALVADPVEQTGSGQQ